MVLGEVASQDTFRCQETGKAWCMIWEASSGLSWNLNLRRPIRDCEIRKMVQLVETLFKYQLHHDRVDKHFLLLSSIQRHHCLSASRRRGSPLLPL